MLHKNLLRAWSLALALTTVAFLGAGCGGKDSSTGDSPADAVDDDSLPGEVLLGLRAGATAAEVSGLVAPLGDVADQNGDGSVLLIKLHDGVTRDAAIAKLSAPEIEYAEPNYAAHVFAVGADKAWNGATPTAPFSADQYSPTVKAQIAAAWGQWANTASITIAVVDTGIKGDHDDLKAKTLDGYNAITAAAITQGAGFDSDFAAGSYHGTRVAGIAAAESGNSLGIAGIASKNNPANWAADAAAVKVVPVKVADATHNPNHLTIAKAIDWASNKGGTGRSPAANVILLSLGSASPSYTLQTAIKYAISQNILVIAAAGNNSSSLPKWPARYQSEGVLSVGAVDATDTLASDANYGTWVNVLAPGVGLLTTDGSGVSAYAGDGTVPTVSGSSYSAAFVAGAAGLIWSKYPPNGTSLTHNAAGGNLSASELRTLLTQSVDGYGHAASKSIQAGGGRLNLDNAMKLAANQSIAAPVLVPATVILSAPSAVTGGTVDATVYLTAKNTTGADVTVTIASTTPATATVPASGTVAVKNLAQSATFKVTAVAAGSTAITAALNGTTVSVPFATTAPGLSGITLAKSSVTGGTDVVGTAKFNKAPAADTTITLTLPGGVTLSGGGTTFTMPLGKTTATFTLNTATHAYAVDTKNLTITAADPNSNKATATLDVLGPVISTFTFDKAATIVWDSAPHSATAAVSGVVTGTVKLTGKVNGAATIGLLTSDQILDVPVTFSVADATDTGTFTAQPEAVAVASTVTVNAFNGTYNATTNPGKAATVKINPALSNLTTSLSKILGTGTATGTLTLTDVVPVGITGNKVTVSVSHDGACTGFTAGNYRMALNGACGALSVDVPVGSKTATFPINVGEGNTVVPVNVTANLLGVDKATVVTADAPVVASVTVTGAPFVGTNGTGTITLSSPVPASSVGGKAYTVALTSSTVGVATVSGASPVTVAANGTTATFTITSVAAGQTTITAKDPTATANSGAGKTVVAKVTAAGISSVDFNGATTKAAGLETVPVKITFATATKAATTATITESTSTGALSPTSQTCSIPVNSTTVTCNVTTAYGAADRTPVNVKVTLASNEAATTTANIIVAKTLTLNIGTQPTHNGAAGAMTITLAATPAAPVTVTLTLSTAQFAGFVLGGGVAGSNPTYTIAVGNTTPVSIPITEAAGAAADAAVITPTIGGVAAGAAVNIAAL